MFNQSSNYFNRSGLAQPDGRTYGERTRQAVNRSGANVTSYRELAAALVNAEDGSLITITESFEVPETILISKNRITITCEGRGGLLPAAENQTLFNIVDADDVTIQGMKVYKNKLNVMFLQFIEFSWIEDKKNVYVLDNYVESLNFMNSTFDWTTAFTPITLNTVYLELFIGQRTYISGNTHRNYQDAPWINEYTFMSGYPQMYTITQNETEAAMKIFGVGNLINSNAIFGLTSGATNVSVWIPSSQQNIVTGNLVAAGGTPVVIGGNLATDNLEIVP